MHETIPEAPPRVSVIIPTHGRKNLLARLLCSLERQSLDVDGYEVIIVHNHTPDGTEEMAQSWCQRQRFQARYFRKNYPGPTRSRQFGASVASGSFLAFIDDDCVATTDWLASGLSGFEIDGRGSARIGLVQGMTLPVPTQVQTFPCKTICIERPTVFFETCNIFYRREVFAAVGGFSEDFLDRFYGEDSDLGWKVIGHGYQTVFSEKALVYHEVFRVSFYKWLIEPLFFKNLPYLVKKHPALRQHMFYRYFLTLETCLFNTLFLALLLAPFSLPGAAVVTLPYLGARYASGGHVGGVSQRLARVILGVPRGLVMWWALVTGSIRARSFLL